MKIFTAAVFAARFVILREFGAFRVGAEDALPVQEDWYNRVD